MKCLPGTVPVFVLELGVPSDVVVTLNDGIFL